MRTEDAIRRLEAANPVDASDLENWPASDRGHEVLWRVVSTPLHRTEIRPHRRRSYRLVLPAVAVIGALVAAVLFVPVSGTRPDATAAAQVLYAAARVAEKQPQTPMPAHGFRYTRSKDAYLSTVGDKVAVSALVPHVREIWIAPDGSGRLLEESYEPMFLGPQDKVKWEEAGRPPLGGPGNSDESFGPGGLYYQNFSEYSIDPDELYDQIRNRAEGHGSSTDSEMLVLVGDLLRETVAPPDLRAALFRVAARIPGVELVGEVTDPAGRKGIAVARTSDDSGYSERDELVFDPETSEMLAERQVLLERVDWLDAEPGTVIGYAVYLESGIVDSTSERP
jgi:hypothetical protein